MPHLRLLLFCIVGVLITANTRADEISNVPALPLDHLNQRANDWLLTNDGFKASVFRTIDSREIVLSNGLARRRFRLSPNAATVALDCTISTQSFLRAARPEAIVDLDGKSFAVGGLTGQPIQNYLKKQWHDSLQSDPKSFTFSGFDSGPTIARFAWKKRPEWYKKYRPILDSDIIHGRRADGRDIGWILHVNPALSTCGLLMVYNPLEESAVRKLRVNLYYTGLKDTAQIREQENPATEMHVGRDYTVELPVKLMPRSTTWFVVEVPKQ